MQDSVKTEDKPKKEKEKKDKVINPKYWIKAGMEVIHRDFPQRRMYVDKVNKQAQMIYDGEKTRPGVFVIGVDCHWVDEKGNFGHGRFLTMELLPWDEKFRQEIIDFRKNRDNIVSEKAGG
jgi:hypothetical protein